MVFLWVFLTDQYGLLDSIRATWRRAMYRLIVGIAATICLVSGCGSAAEVSTPTPLTKAQFIKQADRICAKSAKKRDAAAASFVEGLPGGPAEAEAHLEEGFRRVVAPSVRREAQELAALAPPKGDTAVVSRMIGNLAKAGRVLAEEGPKAMSRSGLPAFEREAAAYGLKICPKPY
jgi:hypothetical protein